MSKNSNKKLIAFQVDNTLLDALERYAAKDSRSVSSAIRKILINFLYNIDNLNSTPELKVEQELEGE